MSLESALSEMAELLRTPVSLPHYLVFQPRLDRLLGAASSIGWGYSDAVDEILDQLDADAGSWAESEVDERDV